MLRWLIVPFWMVVLVSGCKRADDDAVVLDMSKDPRIQAGITERVTRGLAMPRASAALDEWLDGIVADPRVLRQGTALADQLMSDAAVAGAIETIMAKMGQEPAVVAALQVLVAQHPDATPDQIGELFGKQFEVRWETPEVQKAWYAAWDAFVGKLGTGSELSAIYNQVIARVLADLDAKSIDRRINARLVELNGGTRPATERAIELYLQHAWAPERVDDVATRLVTNPTVKRASAAFVADVLALADVSAELQKQAAHLATNPELQARIVRAMSDLYALDADPQKATASLRDLMTHPFVVSGVGELLQLFGNHAKVRVLARTWYDAVRKDAQLRRDLDAFMTGW